MKSQKHESKCVTKRIYRVAYIVLMNESFFALMSLRSK